jgi:hypothetical protein
LTLHYIQQDLKSNPQESDRTGTAILFQSRTIFASPAQLYNRLLAMQLAIMNRASHMQAPLPSTVTSSIPYKTEDILFSDLTSMDGQSQAMLY